MNAPAAATARVPIAAVSGLIDDAMRKAGLPAEDTGTVAELMLEADLIGADAHGVFRLPQYVQRLKLGSTNPRPNITVERSAPATALVHGDNGMGHLVVSRAACRSRPSYWCSWTSWRRSRASSHWQSGRRTASPRIVRAPLPLVGRGWGWG